MLRPQLSAMKFERREGNCIFTTFAKSAAMQMTLLERFRPQIEEALAEAGSEDVVLAFGSLSYLGQVKEAVERLGKKSRTELDKERGMRND